MEVQTSLLIGEFLTLMVGSASDSNIQVIITNETSTYSIRD